ncbi:hypothetical protein ACS0TY_002445 [Phlomoides rotata]
MARPQDPPRHFISFRKIFRMILPKGSSLSPKMLDLLNTFEENLAGRLTKLNPTSCKDFLSFSWMRNAMQSLCETHAEIKHLVTALELSICDWDDVWIEAYFDDSVKLLDINSTFYHEILRLKQGHLHLVCALPDLDSGSPNPFLDAWEQHMSSKNSEVDRVFPIMDSLSQTVELPNIKNSPKEKVMMQALYGLKAAALFICSVFAAAFFGSAEQLVDVRVAGTCLWAEAFVDLQTRANTELSNMQLNGAGALLKELEAVETGVKKLRAAVQDGASVEGQVLQNMKSDFEQSMEKMYGGLDLLAREVNGFFRVVVLGRNALVSNLRLIDYASDEDEDSVEDLKASQGIKE